MARITVLPATQHPTCHRLCIVRAVDSRLNGREFDSWPSRLILQWATDRLRAGKPPQYFIKPPRPTQPPTLRRVGNEYQPKYGDALWLGSTGRYGHSTCGLTCGWQVKLCDPSLTHALPERLRDEQLIIKRYTNNASFLNRRLECISDITQEWYNERSVMPIHSTPVKQNDTEP